MFDTRAAKMALAIAVASVVIAVAVAPLATSAAYAVKTVTPEECLQNGEPTGRSECPGESGGQNPNREQQECEVTGGGGQTVQGQQKKVC
jgi:hypothetical protein